MDEYLNHINKILHDNDVPKLPEEYADNPLLVQIHEELKEIRETLTAFSFGDFSKEINAQGIMPRCLKTLQVNIRHFIRQVQMMEKGDFSHEVRFTGEFSDTFNSMIRRFRLSLSKLRKKRDTLTVMNTKLRKEVEHMEHLKESEAHFKFLASHDPLTGILNRRSFIEMAGSELANAAEYGVPCCLAMMDIDYFKDFNDTYGHPAGDEALCHAVKTVGALLRKNDFMGRYGGEEFIFFFYGADEKIGLKVLERLRTSLSDTPVPLEKGPVEIHASFGFTINTNNKEKTTEKKHIEKLIEDADTALYAAKQLGRNRVVLFSPGMETRREVGANLSLEAMEG